ncbi:MAG: hypothetical protein ACE37B_19535 [Ilumatobacter sp.]|uniref:hypothetical protein n=1 Tax=Ilumatobacter sp. TaxID=1967498 RepID=UPI003919705F
MSSPRLRVFGGFAAVAVAVGAGVWNGASQTAAIDNSVFISSHGAFDDPARDDALAIECVQYGSGDPATFSAVGAPDPSVQAASPGVLNQIRFGRIPTAFGGGCSPDPGASTGLGSSGFGFVGASSPIVSGLDVELGRFIHYNRTIERGVRSVDLTTVFSFDGPGGPVDHTVVLDVDIDETVDFVGVSDTSLCAFDVPENTTVTSPVVATLCADRVSVTPVGALTPAYGVTELLIEVVGFTRVVGGGCDENDRVDGDSFFSAEQQATELCVLAALVDGSLTIDKVVDGGAGRTFDFTLTEHDQRTTPPAPGATRSVQIDATSGAGTSPTMSVPPGIYRVDELDPGPGFVTGPLSCTVGGDDAIVTVDGIEFVNVNSASDVICSFTNLVVPSTTTPPTTTPPTTTPTSTTTTAAVTTTTTLPVTMPTTTTIASMATIVTTTTTAPTPQPPAIIPATGRSISTLSLIAALTMSLGAGGLVVASRRSH